MLISKTTHRADVFSGSSVTPEAEHHVTAKRRVPIGRSRHRRPKWRPRIGKSRESRNENARRARWHHSGEKKEREHVCVDLNIAKTPDTSALWARGAKNRAESRLAVSDLAESRSGIEDTFRPMAMMMMETTCRWRSACLFWFSTACCIDLVYMRRPNDVKSAKSDDFKITVR